MYSEKKKTWRCDLIVLICSYSPVHTAWEDNSDLPPKKKKKRQFRIRDWNRLSHSRPTDVPCDHLLLYEPAHLIPGFTAYQFDNSSSSPHIGHNDITTQGQYWLRRRRSCETRKLLIQWRKTNFNFGFIINLQLEDRHELRDSQIPNHLFLLM